MFETNFISLDILPSEQKKNNKKIISTPLFYFVFIPFCWHLQNHHLPRSTAHIFVHFVTVATHRTRSRSLIGYFSLLSKSHLSGTAAAIAAKIQNVTNASDGNIFGVNIHNVKTKMRSD